MKYVYVLRSGVDHYKIGVAANVTRRMNNLQTSNPNKIELVATKLVEQAEQLEKIVHTFLADHRLAGGTEWFRLTPEQVIEVLVRINQMPEVEGLDQAIELRDIVKKQANELTLINKNLNVLAMHVSRLPNRKNLDNTISKMKQEMPHKKIVVDDSEYMKKAMAIFKLEGKASASLLQRRLSIGYARAGRIMDELETAGLIGKLDGIKPREVIRSI